MTWRIPSRAICLTPDTAPRVVRTAPVSTPSATSPLRVALPFHPKTLLSAACWQVAFAHDAPVTVTHIVRWLLPAAPAPVLSADTRAWHRSPAPPRISPGDGPVMEVVPLPRRRLRRRHFTVIDTRDPRGLITRRFQTFPLAPLTAEDPAMVGPKTPLPPCKENPLCAFTYDTPIPPC